jgi:uncharacterized membrane protein YkgB
MMRSLSTLIGTVTHINRLICAVGVPAHQTSSKCSLSYELANYYQFKEKNMSLGTILLIVLVLLLIGVIPTWSHSRNWGYGPSGGLGLVVIIIVVLLLMGRI